MNAYVIAINRSTNVTWCGMTCQWKRRMNELMRVGKEQIRMSEVNDDSNTNEWKGGILLFYEIFLENVTRIDKKSCRKIDE